MRKVAIVDDEPVSRHCLVNHVSQYVEEKGIHLESTHFESGVQFLERYTHDFELAFLDIEMSGIDGTAQEMYELVRVGGYSPHSLF